MGASEDGRDEDEVPEASLDDKERLPAGTGMTEAAQDIARASKLGDR